jgi:hypothetical protein
LLGTKIYEKEFPFKKFTPIKNKHATTHERRRTSNGIWKLEKAFMKDLLEAYPKPKCNHNHRYFIEKNDRQAV